jgi:uncharacterized membrane protein YfcA
MSGLWGFFIAVLAPILLPIGGLSISVGLLVAVGGVIGLLSGLLGVGGGFLMTPILMMIGVPPTVAAASDTNAIVATSASGVAAHFRLNNVDIRMGTIALVGGLAGSAAGVRVMESLEALGNANLVITLTYIIMLGLVGGLILKDGLSKWGKGVMPKAQKHSRTTTILNRLPWQMDFPRSGVRHSLLLPFALCALVGLMTAVMGVGGGFMLVPAMVYLLGMPAHVAVGTSLFQILFTCMGATVMQAGANHTVDVVLALIVALGSTVGAQVGARLGRFLRGEQLMGILGLLALAVMIKMSVDLIVRPPHLLKKPAGVAELGSPFSFPRFPFPVSRTQANIGLGTDNNIFHQLTKFATVAVPRFSFSDCNAMKDGKRGTENGKRCPL